MSQTVSNCSSPALASPGSVGASVTESTKTPVAIPAGQTDLLTGTAAVTENQFGAAADGTVITFAISLAGVTFSVAPTVAWTGGWAAQGGSSTCALAFDLKSCSVTVPATTTATLGVVTLTSIHVDTLGAAVTGGSVNLNVTTSPAVGVVVGSNTIAYIGRAVVGVGALPTVYIGYNAQPSGLITFTESAAGFFQAGSSGNNELTICVYGNQGETFTFAPYAIVTTGDLKLLNPSTLLGVTSQQGTLSDGNSCASWYVYSGSTVASTVSIVGATAAGALPVLPANGPTLSIPQGAIPGPVRMELYTGNTSTSGTFDTVVTNAIRAYKSGVVVAAVSQPNITPGSTGPAGNITFTETLNGQFQAGEYITCQIIDSTYTRRANRQVLMADANSNQLPVVTTNTDSGLIAYRLYYDQANNSFTIYVAQQAFAPALGVITVSNLNYTVVTGATPGPVSVECYPSDFGSITEGQPLQPSTTGVGADFDAIVSNAIVGSAPVVKMTTGTALGVTKIGPFTSATKVAALNKYITWRFSGGAALAGKTVDIYVATKGSTSWSTFTKLTARVADANGNVYYWFRSSTAKWISVRAYLPAGPNNMASWSPADQGRYK